ncbi:MAG: monovalent cation/H+ antiporter complex subunit F [Candidatus Binatia bacterium]
MIGFVSSISLAVLALSMLPPLYRIARGPSVADRVVAADALSTCILAIVVVSGILSDTRDYTDAVMAIAVVGFFGTVAYAKYLIRGRVID